MTQCLMVFTDLPENGVLPATVSGRSHPSVTLALGDLMSQVSTGTHNYVDISACRHINKTKEG